MIIESLSVKRFGSLSDFKAEPDAGFNLIEGPAESGKSTLAAFIVYMLYGFPEEGRAALSERALRAPWDGAEAEGSMTLSVGEERFLIERSSSYTERGWRDSYILRNLTRGVTETGGLTPGERFLGITAEAFREMAFLSGTRRGAPEDGAVKDAIENIIFSGDERMSVMRAALALKQAAGSLCADGDGSGTVAVLEKERDEWRDRLAEVRAAERERYEREEELYVTRRKKEEALSELEKFTLLETNYYHAVMIDEYDRLHALEDASESRAATIRAHEDAYRVGDFLPDRAYMTELSTVRAEAASAKRELEAALAEQAASEATDDISEDENALLRCVEEAEGEEVLRERERVIRRKMLRFAAVTVSGGALALVLAVLFFLFSFVKPSGAAPFFGAGCLLLLGVFTVSLLEWRRGTRALLLVYGCCSASGRVDFFENLRRAAEIRLRAEHKSELRAQTEARVSRARGGVALAEQALRTTLERFGVVWDEENTEQTVADTIARVDEYLERATALRAEHEAAESEVRALRKKLEGQNEIAVRARVAPDDRPRYRNQNASDLRHGIEHFTERLNLLSEKENELLRELASYTFTESSAEIAERILFLDARIAAQREHAKDLLAAMEAVKGGAARLREEIAPRLSLLASRLLYEMTDGRYFEIAVREGEEISFREGEELRSVSYLSDSTADLAYYSLRLSLLLLLSQKGVPVFFDGCTAAQDDERTLAFLRAIRSLTEEGAQCFFFASGAREREATKEVFGSYRRISMTV